MKKLVLKLSTELEFFEHGREVAKAVDLGQPIPEKMILSFEDPADLTKRITSGHLAGERTALDWEP